MDGMEYLTHVVEMAKGIVCPYDNSHLVTYRTLNAHVDRCRNNYRQQRLARGEDLVFLSCKYNVHHQVDGPELLFHEARCDDRTKTPAYLLPTDYPELELTPEEVETVEKMVKEEAKTLYDGLVVGNITGSFNWGQPQSIFAMRYPKKAREMAEKKAKEAAEEDAKRLAEGFASSVKITGGGGSQVDKGDEKKKKKTTKDAKGGDSCQKSQQVEEEKEDDDDEEDWSKDCNAPRFSYMENVMNPTKPILRYPPGLTKSQRKLFAQWNTEWLANIARKKREDDEREEQGVQQAAAAPVSQRRPRIPGAAPFGAGRHEVQDVPFGARRREVQDVPFGARRQEVQDVPFGARRQGIQDAPFGQGPQGIQRAPFGQGRLRVRDPPFVEGSQGYPDEPERAAAGGQGIEDAPFGQGRQGIQGAAAFGQRRQRVRDPPIVARSRQGYPEEPEGAAAGRQGYPQEPEGAAGGQRYSDEPEGAADGF